jgi:hypothetical protein
MIERIDFWIIARFEWLVDKVHSLTGKNNFFLARVFCVVSIAARCIEYPMMGMGGMGILHLAVLIVFAILVIPHEESRAAKAADGQLANRYKFDSFYRLIRIVSFLTLSIVFVPPYKAPLLVSLAAQLSSWAVWNFMACEYLPTQKSRIREALSSLFAKPKTAAAGVSSPPPRTSARGCCSLAAGRFNRTCATGAMCREGG